MIILFNTLIRIIFPANEIRAKGIRAKGIRAKGIRAKGIRGSGVSFHQIHYKIFSTFT
jgi:hypothetical protein